MRRPFLLLALAGIAGCGSAPGDAAMKVVATTPVMADLVRNVAPPDAEVVTLLKPGADPHAYEVRPADAQALADADLVVRSGGELDQWLEEAREASGSSARVLVPHDPGAGDPHWWHDPRLAVRAVRAIARELNTSPDSYAGRIERLDADLAACFERIPAARRKLVTTHDALGHFARRYGIDIVGTVIPARTTSGQPSAGEVESLVSLIRRERVPAIFPDGSISPKVERAIAAEAGATVGEPLHADTLGRGVTYLEALAHNGRAVAAGLGGTCDA